MPGALRRRTTRQAMVTAPSVPPPEAFFSAGQWLAMSVAVLGTRQLGLFILMHDAAHGLLHPHRRVIRWTG